MNVLRATSRQVWYATLLEFRSTHIKHTLKRALYQLLCLYSLDSQLCKWKEVATTCQFPVATCTDKEHTSYSEYRNSFNCYKKLQKEWKRMAKSSLGATGTSIDTTEVQGLTSRNYIQSCYWLDIL